MVTAMSVSSKYTHSRKVAIENVRPGETAEKEFPFKSRALQENPSPNIHIVAFSLMSAIRGNTFIRFLYHSAFPEIATPSGGGGQGGR